MPVSSQITMPRTNSMEEFVAALPKAELHVHLRKAPSSQSFNAPGGAAPDRARRAGVGRGSMPLLHARPFASFLGAFKTGLLAFENTGGL